MRLWHKDLIPVLPHQQLLGQWRECCLIAKSIAENGTPNHILVNKVNDYNIFHFLTYTDLIIDEMRRRNFKANNAKIEEFKKMFFITEWKNVGYTKLFKDWHNKRYFVQCFFNLQEKYDCGGISDKEWAKISELSLKIMKTESGVFGNENL